MWRYLVPFVAALGCTSSKPPPATLVKALTIEETAPVLGLVEDGGLVFVATAKHIKAYRGTTPIMTAAPTGSDWTSLAIVDAFDGDGHWIIASDSRGDVFRITPDGTAIDLSDRLGVRGVHSLAGAGPTLALVLGDSVVVVDGQHVTKYPVTGRIAVAPRRLALATARDVQLWDLEHERRETFEIAGGTALEFSEGILTVTANGKRFSKDAKGFRQVAMPPTANTTSFASGNHLWISSRTGVDLMVPRNTNTDQERTWHQDVEPIFRRVCARCHLPNGAANVDLSSPAAWGVNATKIYQRVVVERSMPPSTTAMSAADRDAVGRWVGAQRELH